MTRLLGLSLSLATLASAILCAQAAAAGGSPKPAPPTGGRYIVLYDSGVRSTSVGEETGQLERRLDFDATHVYTRAVRGFAARLSGPDVAALRRDPEVRLVSPDRPFHASAVPIVAGGVAPTGVRRVGAATTSLTQGPSSVAVAVLDSGIDLSHPDLNAVNGTNCVGSGPADDDEGHGTHVAGTIGARNNGIGVVGVVPGTTLYAVKVLDAMGNGSSSTLICGIDWVTANARALNIRVANLSLGGLAPPSTCATEALHAAVCNSTAAGVTYAVAAGNSGWDFGALPPDVPAGFPEVLTVTAMADSDGLPGALGPQCNGRNDDVYAGFSNFASPTSAVDTAHTIAAPGSCILSTVPGGGTGISSGTSMASPHGAGAIAACLGVVGSVGPCAGLASPQIIKKVRATAAANGTVANGFLGDPIRPEAGRYYGYLAWVGLPPRATTGAASGVGATSATVAGTVNPGLQATTYRFQYGQTAAYGSRTNSASAGAGAGDQPASATIGGLLPATTYHFRLVAGNASATAAGADHVFTTGPPPPGFYRSYVACGRSSAATPAHACERGEKLGAFFRSRAAVVYTFCLRFPAGGTSCTRNRPAAAGTLQMIRIGANTIGAYKGTWSVNGRTVGSWHFRRLR